jgi:hypothetical protein
MEVRSSNERQAVKDIYEVAKNVRSRDDFVAFLDDLREDFLFNNDEWESLTIPDFLDAWSASLASVDQIYITSKMEGPPELSWPFLAKMLIDKNQRMKHTRSRTSST